LAGILALVLLTSAGVLAGVERGNRLFRSGKYAEAVAVYRAALADGEDGPVVRYNLGTALLRLGRYAEAEEQFRAALDVVDPELREWVFYNLGQRYLEDARESQDPASSGALYDAAVEAYRQALRLRPQDLDAKWNYELALQEREDQQQQGGGGGAGEPPPQDPDRPPNDDGSGGGSGSTDPNPQDPDREVGANEPMTQEQAERILSAVEQNERELFQDKLRKGQEAARAVRDW
jgi:tetratricopeptide (TPR) repeat protein